MAPDSYWRGKYYWIGNKYQVERQNAPSCKCPKPCQHYAKPNKAARRMLRRLSKMQNNKVEQKLLQHYDRIAPTVPKGSHPHKKRQAIRGAIKPMFGLIKPSSDLYVPPSTP